MNKPQKTTVFAIRIKASTEEGSNHRTIREPLIKRWFDIALSSIGLIGSSWLFTLFSIMIIIEDGFPVLIRQGRIGKGGRIFKSIKFRSMIKDALKEKVSVQANENDARITRSGRFLRKGAMDELPQLINILNGDMSFVGPRALLPLEIEINSTPRVLHVSDLPGYEERVKVRPGLTGIAQIYAPRDLKRRHKFKYDILYTRKLSLWTDLKLIFLSFIISSHGTWERRGAKLSSLKRGKDGPLRGRD